MAVPKKTISETSFERKFKEAQEESKGLLKELPKDFIKSYAILSTASILAKAIALTRRK